MSSNKESSSDSTLVTESPKGSLRPSLRSPSPYKSISLNRESQIYVLPCLQEEAWGRKYLGRIGFGVENECGALYKFTTSLNGNEDRDEPIDTIFQKANPSGYSGNRTTIDPQYEERHFVPEKIDKLEFVSRWCGGNLKCSKDLKKYKAKDESFESILTKNELLTIPKCLETYDCKTKSANKKQHWRDLLRFLFGLQKFKDNKVSLMVSHTNRMVGSLMPHDSCDYYNNCACIKITISVVGNNIDTLKTIIYEGETTKKGVESCKYEKSQDIDLNEVVRELTLDGKLTLDGNYVIYLVRHGNGLHNSPLKKKTIDSCLTPLGVEQAFKLGEFLRDIEELKSMRMEDIVVCASFLRRSQHTALAVLKGYNENLFEAIEKFRKGLINFNVETIMRCYAALNLPRAPKGNTPVEILQNKLQFILIKMGLKEDDTWKDTVYSYCNLFGIPRKQGTAGKKNLKKKTKRGTKSSRGRKPSSRGRKPSSRRRKPNKKTKRN